MRTFVFLSLLALASWGTAAPTNDNPTTENVPNNFPFVLRAGLTGDTCKGADDCDGDRRCAPRKTVTFEDCDGRSDCECKFSDPQQCTANSDCAEGEVCATTSKTSNGSSCRSAEAVNSDDSFRPLAEVQPSPGASTTDDGVCIASDALAHLPSHALVFAEHPIANVLCDPHGSCATPGHIVTFRGNPMMMASYCRETVCEKKAMRVNSPRYTRAMRVASRTEDLEYTALAARYQTVAEEKVLRAIVRIGL